MITNFSAREWWYTKAHENLFDLTREEFYLYRLIIKGAP